MVTQTMVMAHAGIGHNAFFKNNVFFKEWTDATNIVDYMVFAKEYIRMCEERYGELEVERVLDACHALAPHGIDKYKRKHQPKMSEELRLQKLLQEEEDRRLSQDVITRRTSFNPEEVIKTADVMEDEENLLYFIMKKSPSLPQWKREIMRICYKMNRYFQPQGATKVSNEGFATFVHYQLMAALENKGVITPDGFISFIDSHASVIFQPPYNSKYWSGINPYALGFAIYMDIKRICENPTEEDKVWMPHLIGKRWQDAVKEAAYNYRDDGFISQYLSPKVMRDLRLFTVKLDVDKGDNVVAFVSDIHDEIGYREMRTRLAQSYERINYVPQIIVRGADLAGDRTLHLEYVPYKGRSLDPDNMEETLQHVDYLWGYAVELDIP
jgi:spore cortex formation protein SpoVR/YcgB (stage V sporulation)